MLIFQFTLPREERRQVQAQPLTLQNFNPRSHERSDSVWNSALYYIQKFQSTLPREERPFPTDFVTAFMPYFNPRSHERSDTTGGSSTLTRAISIHAPTRGATLSGFQPILLLLFQSTLPREERLLPGIHILLLYDFNPRSHERSDGNPKFYETEDGEFQSTLPREERPTFTLHMQPLRYFNPRSHERSDAYELLTIDTS